MPHGENKRSKPRILVAPLDWGLGHATRCIPVIYELLARDSAIWLAAEGAQKALLSREFPQLPILPLPGYRIRYGHSAWGLFKNMFLQTPRLLRTIKKENKWLEEAVKEYEFDAVISDNRFGLHHPDIHCVFITHQLAIKSPFGKWTERMLKKNNYRFINRFSTCWVPDVKGSSNLAGELSHPSKMPAIPVHYIGNLSRLTKSDVNEKKGHLFISLSGPEPQRSLLENKMIHEVSHYGGTATVVRGLPAAASIIPSTNDLHFYNHLSSDEYSREMGKAEFVICRSGYSTVMDLLALGKKSILIATPGQTEQEYLSQYLEEKGIACCMEQKDFTLNKGLEKASKFSYSLPDIQGNNLGEAVDNLMRSLS